MMRALLTRTSTGDQGTFGLLQSGGFSCGILELPWRDNLKQKSCIPEGIYQTKWIKSPKFGFCYQLLDVPGRSNILIHKGNYAGDVDKGFISNSYGCLLPFIKPGRMQGQRAGLMSALAVADIADHFDKESFLLEIRNAYDTPRAP